MAADSFNQRLWLGAVLRAIAKVPAGDRLRIGDLARGLGLTQVDVIATIETLIAEGRLDQATLRPPCPDPTAPQAVAHAGHPPAVAPAPVGDCTPPAGAGYIKVPITVTGPQLFRMLRDEGQKRTPPVPVTTVSFQVFGNRSQLSMMESAKRTPREATRLKCEAWLNRIPAADAPRPCLPVDQPSAREPTGRPSRRSPDMLAGAPVAAEIDAWLAARPDLVRTRVLDWLGFSGGYLRKLRDGARIQRRTVERMRALLANPPLDRLKAAAPSERPRATRCDTTAKPESPVMDGLTVAFQHIAKARRAVSIEAQRILAANPNATKGRNQSVSSAIADLRRQWHEAARQADPIEQAKTALRQRGRVVFDASVDGGRKGRFFVSGQVDENGRRKQLTDVELIKLAQRVNPRTAPQLPTHAASAQRTRTEIIGRGLSNG
jgi:hypothetical protein